MKYRKKNKKPSRGQILDIFICGGVMKEEIKKFIDNLDMTCQEDKLILEVIYNYLENNKRD